MLAPYTNAHAADQIFERLSGAESDSYTTA